MRNYDNNSALSNLMEGIHINVSEEGSEGLAAVAMVCTTALGCTWLENHTSRKRGFSLPFHGHRHSNKRRWWR